MPVKMPNPNGIYIGRVEIENGFVIQSVGMGDSVKHAISRFIQLPPPEANGLLVEIIRKDDFVTKWRYLPPKGGRGGRGGRALEP